VTRLQCVTVIQCVCVSVWSLDSVCVQVLVSVELLVCSVFLSRTLQSSVTSASLSTLIHDVHVSLVQTVQQLTRDIHVFWQVRHTHTHTLAFIKLQGSIQVAQLSYHGETTLQGGLVMAQKWKTGTGRQYFMDIIGRSSTTVT